MTAAPQHFQVDILPVDDGTPRIVTNLGLQWLEYMDGKVRPFHLPHSHEPTWGCVLICDHVGKEVQFDSCLSLPKEADFPKIGKLHEFG